MLWKKISKDDLMLKYGVTFLEIDWTSRSFFINGSLNQAKYHGLLSRDTSNFLGEMPLYCAIENLKKSRRP
jgi:hypothetical protein